MRVVGGRDYYDSALAYGRDEEVVYVRHKENTVKAEGLLVPYLTRLSLYGAATAKQFWRVNNQWRRDGVTFTLRPVEVLFCGKRYGGFQLLAEAVGAASFKDSYYWDVNEFLELLEVNELSLQGPKKYRWQRIEKPQIEAVKEHFEYQGSKALQDYLLENRITTAIYKDWGLNEKVWHVDTPELKNVEFFKRFNAYEAFQEISMWVGGVLPKDGPPMVEITDPKIKLAKHGMDKWSFRTPGRKGL